MLMIYRFRTILTTLQVMGSSVNEFHAAKLQEEIRLAVCISICVNTILDSSLFYSNEPRHDKMCLREFQSRPDTNRPAATEAS